MKMMMMMMMIHQGHETFSKYSRGQKCAFMSLLAFFCFLLDGIRFIHGRKEISISKHVIPNEMALDIDIFSTSHYNVEYCLNIRQLYQECIDRSFRGKQPLGFNKFILG